MKIERKDTRDEIQVVHMTYKEFLEKYDLELKLKTENYIDSDNEVIVLYSAVICGLKQEGEIGEWRCRGISFRSGNEALKDAMHKVECYSSTLYRKRGFWKKKEPLPKLLMLKQGDDEIKWEEDGNV